MKFQEKKIKFGNRLNLAFVTLVVEIFFQLFRSSSILWRKTEIVENENICHEILCHNKLKINFRDKISISRSE